MKFNLQVSLGDVLQESRSPSLLSVHQLLLQPVSLSVSVTVSACLPGPTAAIIVTQLTTPYVGIAPAAGDKQLTGQRTHSNTHGPWRTQIKIPGLTEQLL